jgi:hypothetical protein
MTLLATVLPSVASRFRALLGARDLDPPPDVYALALKHARRLLVDLEHLDLDHPSIEDMLTWRFKAAIDEAIAGNRENMP